MTTDPGTPQTAAGRALPKQIDTHLVGLDNLDYIWLNKRILAIEAEARAAAESLSAKQVRAERDAEVRALRDLLREAIHEVHQTGPIRDHHDAADTTGWNVHGIETCGDSLCVDARAILSDTPETGS